MHNGWKQNRVRREAKLRKRGAPVNGTNIVYDSDRPPDPDPFNRAQSYQTVTTLTTSAH